MSGRVRVLWLWLHDMATAWWWEYGDEAVLIAVTAAVIGLAVWALWPHGGR